MSSTSIPMYDFSEIERAIKVLIEPGAVFEIRILEPKSANRYRPRVISGYFDNPSLVADALRRLQLVGSKGVYITLNPVDPSLLARSHNRFSESKDGASTADKHILRRRWLLVDCDPQRHAGISASDDEKELARLKAVTIQEGLREEGWPEPVVADSGNGYHLLYRLELPADSELVKSCLEFLSGQFSDDSVHIDTSVFNPARIVKLYGTRAEKGDNCPDLGRTHRMSALLSVPDSIEPVVEAHLSVLASRAQAESRPAAAVMRPSSSVSGRSWNRERVQSFIDSHLASFGPSEAQPYDGGFKWVLSVCPFNASHDDRAAAIFIKADGKLGFRCLHDGCRGYNWKSLRTAFAPPPGGGGETSSVLVSEGDTELVSEFGEPVLLNAKDVPVAVNQMFVAGRYARDHLILREPSLSQFYEYDASTGLWQPKTEERLAVEVGADLRRLLQEYGAEDLLRQRTESLLRQIRRLLCGVVERPDAFRRHRPIIHVANGVLHLDESPPTLNDFDPGYYSRNRSEIAFDEDADCPRFIDELLAPALDVDDISLLQRYAGQCLMGYNPSQRLLLMRGTAGGGKSTLANILESVIGPHNVTQLRVQHLDQRFEIAGFVGRTLLAGKDVPGDFLNHKAAYVLKALVGGDRLDAEQKNVKHRFEILGEFNVIITSNTRLHVKLDADSAAWRRRLLIVDYERPPTSKPIPDFARQLLSAEGSGILNWCVAGALRLLDELEEFGTFQLTENQKQRVDALLSESDSVRHFVGECVEPRHGVDITVSELQTAYHAFCETKGWQAVTVRQFERQLGDIMLELLRVTRRTDIKRYDKSQRGFMHVAFKEGDLL
jgi:putative DNA primase/helicase